MIPHWKRADYTVKCLEAFKSAQEYKNTELFTPCMNSLRSSIIDFFNQTKDFDILAKMDNDCLVPKNWLNDILDVFEKEDVDILSPNVSPSNAAFSYGKREPGLSYMPSQIVGGLWVMRAGLVKDMVFADYPVTGITGASSLLKQIIVENNAKVGWVDKVTVEDMGHWSGEHPDHIKSEEHKNYSEEVGRKISWSL